MPTMKDLIHEAQEIVFEYEEKGTVTLEQLLGPLEHGGPCTWRTIYDISQETNPLQFVGLAYNYLRRVEHAASVYQVEPKKNLRERFHEAVDLVGQAIRLVFRGSPSVDPIAFGNVRKAAHEAQGLIPSLNEMERIIVEEDISALSPEQLLDRANLLKEALLERILWSQRIVQKALPQWLNLEVETGGF